MSQIYSIRLNEDELKILQFISNRVKVSKAQIIKLALYEYLENHSSELPKDLQISQKINNVKSQMKYIKRLRWLSYQIDKAEKMIEFYNKMKSENNTSGFLKNIDIDKMIILEKELLRELNELMEMVK